MSSFFLEAAFPNMKKDKEMSYNRIHNTKNPWQGDFKKVLCVCSAGLLRSPTAAEVLSQEPYNFNTRAVGIVASHALIPLDAVHLHWADEVVVMTQEEAAYVLQLATDHDISINVVCLNIQDNFKFRDPRLIDLIKETYKPIEIPKYETTFV
jgi:predicted protein tyrosine phosphatase